MILLGDRQMCRSLAQVQDVERMVFVHSVVSYNPLLCGQPDRTLEGIRLTAFTLYSPLGLGLWEPLKRATPKVKEKCLVSLLDNGGFELVRLLVLSILMIAVELSWHFLSLFLGGGQLDSIIGPLIDRGV